MRCRCSKRKRQNRGFGAKPRSSIASILQDEGRPLSVCSVRSARRTLFQFLQRHPRFGNELLQFGVAPAQALDNGSWRLGEEALVAYLASWFAAFGLRFFRFLGKTVALVANTDLRFIANK